MPICINIARAGSFPKIRDPPNTMLRELRCRIATRFSRVRALSMNYFLYTRSSRTKVMYYWRGHLRGMHYSMRQGVSDPLAATRPRPSSQMRIGDVLPPNCRAAKNANEKIFDRCRLDKLSARCYRWFALFIRARRHLYVSNNSYRSDRGTQRECESDGRHFSRPLHSRTGWSLAHFRDGTSSEFRSWDQSQFF